MTIRFTPCWMKVSIWVFWLARSSCASWVLDVAPIFAAASLAPLSMAEKNGLDMSWTMSPIFSIFFGLLAAGCASPELQAVRLSAARVALAAKIADFLAS